MTSTTNSQHPAASSPFAYSRRSTRAVIVGDVGIGGEHPISVQSMTTTRGLDTEGTVAQTVRLVEAGCEIVRVTAPGVEDAANLREVRSRLRALGVRVPLVADIHFNPQAAIEAAKWVEKVRINPGNYADARSTKRDYTDAEYDAEIERIEERLLPLIRSCRERGVAMRIGTNHGSLSGRITSRYGDTPLGMVESALEFVRACERHDYREIVLSMKASNPKVMIQAYRLLATRMAAEGMAYPFHLGVTEAGSGVEARVKSAAGIGALLDDGIGDTIRVSLAEAPEAEIPTARAIVSLYRGDEAAARLRAANATPRHPVVEARDPFVYRRRESAAFTLSNLKIGAGAPPAVVAEAPLDVDDVRLGRLFATFGGTRAWPDALVVTAAGRDWATDLAALRDRLASLGASIPVVASVAAGEALPTPAGLTGAAGVRLTLAPDDSPESVAAAAALGRPLWLRLTDEAGPDDRGIEHLVERALAALDAAARQSAPKSAILLGLRGADPSRTVRAIRLLSARLADRGDRSPLAVEFAAGANHLTPVPDAAALPVEAPVALGGLFADGLGDAVVLDGATAGLDAAAATRLAFDCLQAVGARSFRAEVIACPGCGRTLFDLASTTERIKARVGHLVGVKVAVMGCVVNGPGELADADFGYMGGAADRVSLYAGHECVERNVPAAEAESRLVALIKSRGRWVEP